MADPIDWGVASWDGHRRRQHQDFQALSFRDKLVVIEQLGEVAAFFAERRRARGLPVRSLPTLPASGKRDDADPGQS
jgi:hypothetical protein